MSKEPVAYINIEKRTLEWAKPMRWETPTIANLEPIPMYTHAGPAVVRKPLTDEQIDALQLPESGTGTVRDLVKIIEAAHGIGCVMSEQKPVAWMIMNGDWDYQLMWSKQHADALSAELQERHDLSGSLAAFHVMPLYTHPAPDLANDFNPDWDIVAPMVEEQQRMAARVEALESILRQLLNILGPTAPACSGCTEEWQAAIDLIKGELE